MTKKNVILDLDNTLISAEPIDDFPFDKSGMDKKALQFVFHDMDGYYIVFERPFLQSFLDDLFSKYNVSIWTAASKGYAMFIVKNIILQKPERQLDYIMFSYQCECSTRIYNTPKKLALVWDTFKLAGYNRSNTLIIDDLPTVKEAQPDNAINIYAFEILDKGSENDTVLRDVTPNEIEQVFEVAASKTT